MSISNDDTARPAGLMSEIAWRLEQEADEPEETPVEEAEEAFRAGLKEAREREDTLRRLKELLLPGFPDYELHDLVGAVEELLDRRDQLLEKNIRAALENKRLRRERQVAEQLAKTLRKLLAE